MRKRLKVVASLMSMLMVASLFASGCSQKTETTNTAPKQEAKQETKKEETKKEEAKSDIKYPTKPIQVIVPAGAGGDTDLNARTLAKYLEKELGQSVVIVNVNGASGTVGTKKVLDADKDGYTVLFYHPSMLMNKILGMVDYTYSDYENGGVAVVDDTNAFVVNAESPLKNMKDLIEAAKKSPKTIKYATEMGGTTHLQALMVQEATGVEFNIVDVGASAQKTAALLGKQIDVIGTQYGLVQDHIKSGKFRALGIMAKERVSAIPDVPTFKEQGVDVTFSKYYGFFFPKGTPKEIVSKFTGAVEKVTKTDGYKADAAKMLCTPTYKAPADAVKYIGDMEAQFAKFKEKMAVPKK